MKKNQMFQSQNDKTGHYEVVKTFSPRFAWKQCFGKVNKILQYIFMEQNPPKEKD